MPVSDLKRCRRCDALVSDSTLGGLCPVCLLERSLVEGDPDGVVDDVPLIPPIVAQSFGDFDLVEEIARGGMGVVYRAIQRGLDRVVALKIIIGGPWSNPTLRARFLLEARAAATLDHPNIVPVFGYGEHAGHAFLSLRLIEGGTLAGALATGRWSLPGGTSPEDIARFLIRVADAVHHAHQRGVLHRDLKPSNILIDDQGRPLVTDFGLAKLRDLESSLTHSSAILGTPSYMPPEQAAGKSSEVTVAADIYSLGAVFYEMLTGHPPFTGENPLQTITHVARNQAVPPLRLNPHVPGDLSIICMKCLRWEPGDRYPSAEELARDLDRWLNHEPIAARSITPIERLGYWIRRRPTVAALSGIVFLLLVVSMAAGSFQAVRLHHATLAATASASESRERLQRMYLQNWQEEVRVGNSLRSLPWLLEAMKLTPGNTPAMGRHRERLRSILSRSPTLEHLWFAGSLVEKLSASPDGTLLAACQYGGQVRVWNTATGKPAYPIIQHTNYVVRDDGYEPGYLFIWNVQFSPNGRHLLTACNHDAFLWEATTGKPVGPPFAHSNKVWQAAFDRTGARFATASLDHHARVFQVDTGTLLLKSPEHPLGVIAVDFNADGTLLATGCRDGGARVFQISDGAEIQPALRHDDQVVQVRFHPDANILATASRDGTARIWDLSTGTFRLLPHEGPVNTVDFSPDGTLLVTASADHGTRIWDVASGRIHNAALRHQRPVNKAVFDPTGERVVSISDDGQVHALRVADDRPTDWAVTHNHHVTDVVVLPGGERIATASADGLVKLSRLPSVTVPDRSLKNPHLAGPDWDIIESADGKLAFRINDRTIAEQARPPSGLYKAVPDAARRQVYLIDAAYNGHIWNLAENRLRPFHWVTNQCLETAAFTSDGRRILLNCAPKEVTIWNLQDDTLAPLRAHHERTINHVTISPDDRFFATASDEPGARIWRMSDGQPLSPLLPHSDFVRLVQFSPDGNMLVSADLAGQVKIWTVPDGIALQKPLIHLDPVEQIFFSPSGEHLATVTTANDVRVWRARDSQLLTSTFAHDDSIRAIHFSKDERLIRTVTLAGFNQVWDLESDCPVTMPTADNVGPRDDHRWEVFDSTPLDFSVLQSQIALLSGARISAGGDFERLDLEELKQLWEAGGSIRPSPLHPAATAEKHDPGL